MKAGIIITDTDAYRTMRECLADLPDMDVLVGIPQDDKPREDGAPINNASLGYIHEFGSPEMNIPARPWLVPGVSAAKNRVAAFLKQAGRASLDGDKEKVKQCMMAAGLVASTAVKRFIVAGDFQPLAEATLKARARRAGKGKGLAISKGAKAELESREAGNAPSTTFAKPLNDTAQMRNSVTYVLRGVKQ